MESKFRDQDTSETADTWYNIACNTAKFREQHRRGKGFKIAVRVGITVRIRVVVKVRVRVKARVKKLKTLLNRSIDVVKLLFNQSISSYIHIVQASVTGQMPKNIC